ncbi:MAG: hypothetical protein ACFFC6_14855 [Promethearchaeota archaeon]
MKNVSLRTLIFIIILLGLIITLCGCVGDETAFGGNLIISTIL